MQYMKLSTSRDFRINTATLDAALQEQDSEVTQPPSSLLKCVFVSEWWMTAQCLCPQEEGEEPLEPKQKKKRKQ